MNNSEYREKCLAEKGRVCRICGGRDDIVVHHIDGDRDNNDLENLIPLCNSCHSRIHTQSNPSGKIAELQDELPDYSISHRSGDGETRKTVALSDEAKSLLDEKKPRGITQGLFIKYAIETMLPIDRMDSISPRYDIPVCPGCRLPGTAQGSFYSGYECVNPDCEVVVYDPAEGDSDGRE